MQTNSAVEQNKNIKWSESVTVNPIREWISLTFHCWRRELFLLLFG